MFFFFFQAEDGIRDSSVTGVQTCALPISGCGDPGYRGRMRRAAPWRRSLRTGGRRLRSLCRRGLRSGERRVGKECRSRWAPDHLKKKKKKKRIWRRRDK